MSEFRKPRSLFFPLLLVAVGIFIFLINTGKIEGTTWDNLLQYWPAILIIGGLDGLYKRDGWIGPLVLLGLGTVLLLGNLHYLAEGGFALLLKLWPVLLVAIGLDIAFGHRGTIWNNLIRIFLAVLLVAAIVWLAVASPFTSGMKSADYSHTLDNAQRSDITFSVAAGELKITGGAEKNLLLIGEAGLPREMTLQPSYTAPVAGKSELILQGNGVELISTNATSRPWDFKLNSFIPINLHSKLGVGEMTIDLTGTKVSEIKAEIGVGAATLTVPAGVDVDAELKGAIGELVIRIPKGCQVEINTHTAIGSTDLPIGYSKFEGVIRNDNALTSSQKITLIVDMAIGSIVIEEIDS
jgi:hypothetical protein